jgi:Glycolipid transfer protein (GLTP)
MSLKNWFASRTHTFKGTTRPDGHIKCDLFLKAAKEFTTILNDQTHLVFIPIKSRFGNNVRQMQTVYDDLMENNNSITDVTLHDLISYEKALGCSDINNDCATRGVVWFTRACQFLCNAFDRSLENEDEPLSNSFRESYAYTLNIHHDGLVKPLFDAAMKFCPDRAIFYKQLCRSDSMETTLNDARIYFKDMKIVHDRLVQYCVYQNWDVRYGKMSFDDMKKCYLKVKKEPVTTSTNMQKNKKQKLSIEDEATTQT